MISRDCLKVLGRRQMKCVQLESIKETETNIDGTTDNETYMNSDAFKKDLSHVGMKNTKVSL